MEQDTFGQFKEEIRSYGEALGEVGKLRLVRTISRVLGLFLLIFNIVLLIFALFAFGAVAMIDLLANIMPVWAASLIMGAIYLLLIALTFVFRKPLFVEPFIKLLTAEIRTEEELALKTIEAEHEAELKRIRIESHVEQTTREIELITGLVQRVWKYLKGLFSKR